MGHNSGEYIHTITEALKIAFADREKFYGDPRFVTVPISGLLSKEYAEKCAGRIRDTASPAMPLFGNPWEFNNSPHAGRLRYALPYRAAQSRPK